MNQAVLNKDPKGDFEYLYLKNVPVVYASVQEPKFKYQSKTEKEYALTAFVNDETRAFLEDEVKINKTLYKVGVDKNKKRVVKYKLSSQQDGDEPDTTYDAFEGLNGISLTLNEKKKNGDPATLAVVDSEGIPIDDLVGNGSVCSVKCWGYRNQDDLLVVSLSIVQVHDLVHYEAKAKGPIVDDELGINTSEPASADSPEDNFDDDIPF